ncbi:MAG: triose-phosphate isomerase [Turicibacter sp.]|nr:triose-phosphate isomerase [Turicibacter sp.]
MRKPIITGNWKMNKTRDEALQFIYAVKDQVTSSEKVESVICAPFPYLRCLVKRQGDFIRVGAQNMHFENSGAYTGEVSPDMLTSIGVSYVILGHSERREMFNETDESVNKKVHAAFAHQLIPIVCVGESLEDRENNTTNQVVDQQTVAALVGLTVDQVKQVVIAYEPIWAIGTGRTATAEQANETIGYIRQVVERVYGKEAADAIRIQYGGSVNPSNIKELMSQEHIDGALVGGASLDPKSFLSLVNYQD